MSYAIVGSITGAPMDSLTTPGYNTQQDVSPNSHSNQAAVVSTSGTQAGVTVHSASDPFTLTVERPAQFRSLGKAHPVTGVISNVPRNVYTVRTRKGVLPLAGQARLPLLIETKISVPAGADTADIANIEAALSLHIGSLWGQSNKAADLSTQGLL